jgi:hypothetical protein
MALDPVINFGKVIVSTGYGSTDTALVLFSGQGARLPNTFAYNLVWWNSTDYADPADDPNVEIIRVNNRTVDVLSVFRGQEGTTASNKNTPGKVYQMILAPTKKLIDDINSYITLRFKSDTAYLIAGAVTVSGLGLGTNIYRILLTGYGITSTETLYIDPASKSPDGFTIHSTNHYSTAQVDWLVSY